MKTIVNGIVLKGVNLEPSKENLLIDDGKIIEIAKDIKEGEIIDADGCIVCPSFLNAHTHIGDSIIKDETYGLSIEDMVKPPNGVKHVALSNASDEEIIKSMKIAMWEMLDSGTTHFIDYREGGIKGIKLLKEASKDIPINPTILGRDDSFYEESPDLHKVKIAIRKILKEADGIAPSGFGEINKEVADLITEKCADKGKISSIHVAETQKSQYDAIDNFNKTEVKMALESKFNQLVHCTNPVGKDINWIANSNSNLVLCPRANASLGVGIAPLYKFLNMKIKPLIGTDNLMINSPNIIRELEFSMKISSVYYNKYIDPKEVLKLATSNICYSSINRNINKSIIEKDNFANLLIIKQISKNPYLSIINRCETKNIIYTMTKSTNNN